MTSRPDPSLDKRVPVQVGLTIRQLHELSERAGLSPWDGRARSEYIVGYLFDEPRDALLERVRRTRDAERVSFRAELEDGRAKRARRQAAPADT